MLHLFATSCTICWNYLVLYSYTFFQKLTRFHPEEHTLLTNTQKNIDSHFVVDYHTQNGIILGVIVKKPIYVQKWNVLSIYDNDLNKDVTQDFAKFVNYYNPQTHTFKYLDTIKKYIGTSENLTLMDELLEIYNL